MMNDKKKRLIAELEALLKDDERLIYRPIIDFLMQLGYLPEKQNVQGFVLSFKHDKNGKVMAKIGVRSVKKQKPAPFISIKFFGCKNVPEKYMHALRQDMDSRNMQYCGPLRSGTERNRCGYCNSCTGGGVGYYYIYPDGRETLRCGAYPIPIPDLTQDDVAEMKKVILEQHEYFLSIA